VALKDFRGNEEKNQMSFLRGDKLLVLRAKAGANWHIGERVGSEVRGLYPVDFVEASTLSSPRPARVQVQPIAAKPSTARNPSGFGVFV
jgi:hypothetical protein